MIDRAENRQSQIMLRLFYTMPRASEIGNIAVEEINLDACKMFIERGKRDNDPYILVSLIRSGNFSRRSKSAIKP